MGEVAGLKTLFNGPSELRQLFTITSALGAPGDNYNTDEEGAYLGGGSCASMVEEAHHIGFHFSKVRHISPVIIYIYLICY